MNRDELVSTYDAKVAEDKKHAKPLREKKAAELAQLQAELKPLFNFLAIVKRWVRPIHYMSFTVPLPDVEAELYGAYTGGEEDVKMPSELYVVIGSGHQTELTIRSVETLDSYLSYTRFNTITSIRNEVDVLKVLATLDFDTFMKALMDVALENDLDFQRLMRKAKFHRSKYIRQNCH